jgi:hypothetical protein
MGYGRERGKDSGAFGVAQSGFTAFFSTLATFQAGGPLTSRWRLALARVRGAAQEASTLFA